jgi:hypothetical protein
MKGLQSKQYVWDNNSCRKRCKYIGNQRGQIKILQFAIRPKIVNKEKVC